MNVPDNLLYTNEHEWAALENGRARIGITDYAQNSLGDITFVELPKAGDKLEQFKIFATVESVKAASDIYAPFSGVVVEVNEALANQPELLNQFPYADGWLVIIKIDNEDEKSKLMDAESYKNYLKEVEH